MLKILIFFVPLLILISGCTTQVKEATPELIEFSTCLTESGVKMYGSVTCSVCKRQKSLFGTAFENIGEIECHPNGENPQTELCLQNNIEKTPTWVIEINGEEVKRAEGYQKLSDLAEFSGCPWNI